MEGLVVCPEQTLQPPVQPLFICLSKIHTAAGLPPRCHEVCVCWHEDSDNLAITSHGAT